MGLVNCPHCTDYSPVCLSLTLLLTAKAKDRFPTYFEYHELAQEIPAIAKEMEAQAQQFGAWKAKALSGSEEGSPNSFISNNRPRSRSIDTSASWDVPDVSEPLPTSCLALFTHSLSVAFTNESSFGWGSRFRSTSSTSR
jgi:hypothetical protein